MEATGPRERLVEIFSVMKDLISMKRNFFMLKDYDDFLDNDQYQESLQILEAEVRNHIKIQQQLKLFMEMQQSKADEIGDRLQKKELEINDQIKAIEKENGELQGYINKKEQEITKLKSSSDIHLKEELLKLKIQSQKDSERICELEKNTKFLMESWMEVESNIEKQKIIYKSVVKENKKLKHISSNKSKSPGTDRFKVRGKLVQNISKKHLIEAQEKRATKRSISPATNQKVLCLSKSNINLQSKKSLIRDESMEKIQTERQLTTKRKF